MTNIGSYEEKLKNFDWSISESELGYHKGDKINIGCTAPTAFASLAWERRKP